MPVDGVDLVDHDARWDELGEPGERVAGIGARPGRPVAAGTTRSSTRISSDFPLSVRTIEAASGPVPGASPAGTGRAARSRRMRDSSTAMRRSSTTDTSNPRRTANADTAMRTTRANLDSAGTSRRTSSTRAPDSSGGLVRSGEIAPSGACGHESLSHGPAAAGGPGRSALPTASAARHHDPMELDGNGLEVLGRSACLDLLGSASIGRVALCIDALPVVLPVTFSVHDRDLVICAMGGRRIACRTRRHAWWPFQADGHSQETGLGWSVLVQGVVRVRPRTSLTPGRRPTRASDLG